MSGSATRREYRIRTVTDFLKIPEDRRQVCLREFAIWLSISDAMKPLIDGIPIKYPDEFVWTDDDKHHVKVSISDGNEKIVIASGTMRGFDD